MEDIAGHACDIDMSCRQRRPPRLHPLQDLQRRPPLLGPRQVAHGATGRHQVLHSHRHGRGFEPTDRRADGNTLRPTHPTQWPRAASGCLTALWWAKE